MRTSHVTDQSWGFRDITLDESMAVKETLDFTYYFSAAYLQINLSAKPTAKPNIVKSEVASWRNGLVDYCPSTSTVLEPPGEFRNRVYDYYTSNFTSLGINRNGFASTPPLVQVSRQVREEMGKLVTHELATTSVYFEAVAGGYNFGHTIRYIMCLTCDSAAPV